MRYLLVFIVMLGILFVPNVSKATFFDDSGGKWWMNPSWWEYGTAWDPDNKGSLIDQNDRLEWITTPEWTDGAEVSEYHGSRWTFLLNDDFEFNVGFHYNHTGTFNTDEGGIDMGLIYWEGGTEPSHIFSIGAENFVHMDGVTPLNKNVFSTEMITPELETGSWWRRANSDGMLYARYDASDDELYLEAHEQIEGNWESVGGTEFYGLKNELGLDELRLYFGGWSEGAGLASGDAYLQNFNVVKGTMTPEPIATMLFLAGGALFGGRLLIRRRRRGL